MYFHTFWSGGDVGGWGFGRMVRGQTHIKQMRCPRIMHGLMADMSNATPVKTNGLFFNIGLKTAMLISWFVESGKGREMKSFEKDRWERGVGGIFISVGISNWELAGVWSRIWITNIIIFVLIWDKTQRSLTTEAVGGGVGANIYCTCGGSMERYEECWLHPTQL